MLAFKIIKLAAGVIYDLLHGEATPESIADALLEAAVATGLPSNVLAQFLSEKGKIEAEFAADELMRKKLGEP